MSLDLRILLIAASVLMLLAVVIRIRKSKFQIRDGVFWFLLSALFLLMSIFPELIMSISGLIGVESPANLVFLGIIAIVLVKNFLLSAKISQLEYNLMKLTQQTMVESVSKDGKASTDDK
jgi:hypothetical protein